MCTFRIPVETGVTSTGAPGVAPEIGKKPWKSFHPVHHYAARSFILREKAMHALEHTLFSGKLAWLRAAALLVSVLVVVRTGLEILPDWQNPDRGWEAYWIAKSIAAGKGFSFPSEKRWLFEVVRDGGFHPTAWADPFYTFCLAGIIRLFGNHHQLAALVFNLVLLLAVFLLTYRLGERLLSAQAGVMAVLALALIRDFPRTAGVMNNTLLAATMIALSALMMLKFLEKPDYRRSGVFGLTLGMTALACPGAQLFIPVTAIAMFLWYRREKEPAVPQAIIVFFMTAVLIMLPWTARNYLLFGKFIPVRTGSGQIAFVSVVSTAVTVAPDKLRSHVRPPWEAGSPRASIIQYSGNSAANLAKRMDLERYQMDYAKDVAPPEFAAMNEYQRDAWFLQESKAFITSYPVLSAQLAMAKIEVFIRTGEAFYGLGALLAGGVCLLAALGGLLAIRSLTTLTLALWVGIFVGPFLVITPFFYRYRAPIEPLLVVLAAFAVCRFLEFGFRKSNIRSKTQREFPVLK